MRCWIAGILLFLAPLSRAVPQGGGPVPAETHDRLWVQTSADYKANCYQVYGWASRVLRERAELNPDRDAQGRLVQRIQVSRDGRLVVEERPLAVIMDLDETVIDMSPYRIFMLREKRGFDWDSWNLYLRFQAESPANVRAVPGAPAFIAEAERLGFTVFFVSNRLVDSQLQTMQTLAHLGISQAHLEERLLLDPGRERDRADGRALGLEEELLGAQGRKETRRQKVRQKYQPVVLVGDDLADFVPFVPGQRQTTELLKARSELVESQKSRWGTEFFFIPNPMYGHWSPGGTLPADNPEQYLRDDGFIPYFRQHSPK